MKTFLGLALTILFTLPLEGAAQIQAASGDQFQVQVNQAIQQAEKDVQNAQYNATRTDVAPTTSSQIQFQNAIVQLDVKKTLANNFRGSASLASPLVRQKLLDVLNKSLITPADLTDLQTTVILEKERMQAASQAQQTTTPTTPSTTTPTTTQPTTPSGTTTTPSPVTQPTTL